MSNTKFVVILGLMFFLFTACSLVDKIKQKINDKKQTSETNDTWDVKEETKESTSSVDMTFYNKYIDAMNKIQDAGEEIQKSYVSSIPEPSSINKNSLIIPVGFTLAVSSMERTMKEYKRSLLDGGELSKLQAAGEMKQEIETDFRNLLSSMENYFNVSTKVSDYYSKGEFKNDLSKAVPFDNDMKSAYDKYKTDLKKFSDDLKRHKPKRKAKDPSKISDPDERAATIMLNAYGNILDAAEEFYENFDGLERNGDFTAANESFNKFKTEYAKNKNDVMTAEFSEKTKFMKYSFEDYFAKMSEKFIEAGDKFFEKAPGARNDNEFRNLYNGVIDNYNNMINSHNTSIQTLNTFRAF